MSAYWPFRSLGGNFFCAESDFEVRFAKFAHLAIAQNGSRRVSGKNRALGNRVNVNVLNSGSKEWIKTLAAISPYRRRFQKFKKGFGARLICFHLLIESAPIFDKM